AGDDGVGQHADAAGGYYECERGGDGDAVVHASRVEDDLGDHQRGRDHADGDRGRECGSRFGGPIDCECHVTDCGGERHLDDHVDSARCERQSAPGAADGVSDDGGGQHADAAGGHDERERGGDGHVVVDLGRVQDDL